MAFLIGMTSETPAVRSFSLYSAVAISICFFYQLIMFTAVLAASGYRESRGRQSVLCWRKANPKFTEPHKIEIFAFRPDVSSLNGSQRCKPSQYITIREL
ncbi:unnamed protein product [Nippostrongylus brasiliensis]|uniref:SSD domain-containing protein n=1 Tax=Nippostrongylus brasiliensis TaxID=27835 RepID=A0A0N4XRJ9_NIPBR|nr:unnamed protein product [Nippostrongylus brasiliensis]